eukprot:scaffold69581_cov18-Tisochrysis_lutea.AAC.1
MPPSHGNEGHGGHSESQSLGENTVRGCAGLGCCVCGGMPVFSGGMLETKSHWPERRNTPAKHRLPALAQSKEGGPGFFLFYDVGTSVCVKVISDYSLQVTIFDISYAPPPQSWPCSLHPFYAKKLGQISLFINWMSLFIRYVLSYPVPPRSMWAWGAGSAVSVLDLLVMGAWAAMAYTCLYYKASLMTSLFSKEVLRLLVSV